MSLNRIKGKTKETSKGEQPQKLKIDRPKKMRKNQPKKPESSKGQSAFFPPNNHITFPASNHIEMGEMTEIEFIICKKRIIEFKIKIIELQEYIERQSKEAKNHDKTMQGLTDHLVSIEKNVTDMIQLKNLLQEFYNAISCINGRTDEVEERISELED